MRRHGGVGYTPPRAEACDFLGEPANRASGRTHQRRCLTVPSDQMVNVDPGAVSKTGTPGAPSIGGCPGGDADERADGS